MNIRDVIPTGTIKGGYDPKEKMSQNLKAEEGFVHSAASHVGTSVLQNVLETSEKFFLEKNPRLELESLGRSPRPNSTLLKMLPEYFSPFSTTFGGDVRPWFVRDKDVFIFEFYVKGRKLPNESNVASVVDSLAVSSIESTPCCDSESSTSLPSAPLMSNS